MNSARRADRSCGEALIFKTAAWLSSDRGLCSASSEQRQAAAAGSDVAAAVLHGLPPALHASLGPIPALSTGSKVSGWSPQQTFAQPGLQGLVAGHPAASQTMGPDLTMLQLSGAGGRAFSVPAAALQVSCKGSDWCPLLSVHRPGMCCVGGQEAGRDVLVSGEEGRLLCQLPSWCLHGCGNWRLLCEHSLAALTDWEPCIL